ncbi:hypothetical protein XENOCAPTIV_025683, partial [Xenoophorus captivus]
ASVLDLGGCEEFSLEPACEEMHAWLEEKGRGPVLNSNEHICSTSSQQDIFRKALRQAKGRTPVQQLV